MTSALRQDTQRIKRIFFRALEEEETFGYLLTHLPEDLLDRPTRAAQAITSDQEPGDDLALALQLVIYIKSLTDGRPEEDFKVTATMGEMIEGVCKLGAMCATERLRRDGILGAVTYPADPFCSEATLKYTVGGETVIVRD